MVQQITKGIKISVETSYKGIKYRDKKLYHVFPYVITIENKSSDTVKLTDRFWQISDSLHGTKFMNGEGVVGQTPTIAPNEIFTYSSGCFLESNFGAMKGFYTMINLKKYEQFKVYIPTFQLTIPVLLN